MLAEIRRTHERGRRRPRLEVANSPPLTGELTLSTTHYRGVGSVASLALQERGNQTRDGCLAVLFEPQLVTLLGGGMRFRGIEAVNGVGYAQEWLVDLIR